MQGTIPLCCMRDGQPRTTAGNMVRGSAHDLDRHACVSYWFKLGYKFKVRLYAELLTACTKSLSKSVQAMMRRVICVKNTFKAYLNRSFSHIVASEFVAIIVGKPQAVTWRVLDSRRDTLVFALQTISNPSFKLKRPKTLVSQFYMTTHYFDDECYNGHCIQYGRINLTTEKSVELPYCNFVVT